MKANISKYHDKILPLLSSYDRLYIQSLEDRKYIKSYTLSLDFITLYYVSGGCFPMDYTEETQENLKGLKYGQF